MWKPDVALSGGPARRAVLGLTLGLTLVVGVVFGSTTAFGAPPRKPSRGKVRTTLKHELALLESAKEIRRGILRLEREQESVGHAADVLDHRARESLRRLDSYRVARGARQKQTRRRSRALYKLARGGMPRLIFEDTAERTAVRGTDVKTHAASDRVVRGRTVRWLVLHDLRELQVHQRAEEGAREELLAATRELAAVSTIRSVHVMQTHALAAAEGSLAPYLDDAAKRSDRLARRLGHVGSREKFLLAKVARERRSLARGEDLDLLGPDALTRPVRGRVVGRFGDYKDRKLGVPMRRNGLELRAKAGQSVVAAAAGEVTHVGALPGFDHVVVITHPGGIHTLTGRLISVKVDLGDSVEPGDVLGVAAPKAIDDGLGLSVYFELRHGTRAMDPTDYLTAR